MPEQPESNKFADRLVETIRQHYEMIKGKTPTKAELKKEAKKILDRRVGK